MNTLESGQVMIVRAAVNGATVSFTEAAKTTLPGVPDVFFTSGQTQRLSITLTNNANVLVDGTLIQFNTAYNNAVDFNDALKLQNTGENISILNGSSKLAVDNRQPATISEDEQVYLTQLSGSNYTLKLTATNMDAPGFSAYLKDNYNGNIVPLNLIGETAYPFAISADVNTYSPTRFIVQYRPAATLPVLFTLLNAQRINAVGIDVKWNTANEINVQKYNVQRSDDAVSFKTTGTIPATGSPAYIFTDKNATINDNYYRIISVDVNGTEKYSPVVKVNAINKLTDIILQENPVKDHIIHLNFINKKAGNYVVNIINAAGQLVYKNIITVSSNFANEAIVLPGIVAAGNYNLNIYGGPGNKQTLRSTVQ